MFSKLSMSNCARFFKAIVVVSSLWLECFSDCFPFCFDRWHQLWREYQTRWMHLVNSWCSHFPLHSVGKSRKEKASWLIRMFSMSVQCYHGDNVQQNRGGDGLKYWYNDVWSAVIWNKMQTWWIVHFLGFNRFLFSDNWNTRHAASKEHKY